MEWGIVPAANMAGMAVSLVISVGLPVVLGIVLYKKTHARIAACLAGGLTFIISALILEQILHMVVMGLTGTLLQDSIVLYGLYGASAAALFEETGRLAAMKFLKKKQLTKNDALMYGIGHGGTESVLIVGIACVNNVITSALINSGGIRLAVAQMDPAMKQTVYDQLQALWQLPAYSFYMAGVERISAIAIQICCSLLVYMFVRSGRAGYLAGAYGLHWLVDFLTVIAAAYLPVWAVELGLMAIAAAALYATWRNVYEKRTEE